MLQPTRSLLARPAFLNLSRARPFSQTTPTATEQVRRPSDPVKHTYFVDRNSRGSLPVYSDVRAQGNKYLILVRNVEGNVRALADDLASSLFPPASPESVRLKIQIVRSKHLVLSGGRWKQDVVDWLQRKGF